MKLVDKSLIPIGLYCYDENGICPYWDTIEGMPYQESGYCHYLKKGDWDFNSEKSWKLTYPEKGSEMQSANEIGLPMSLLWDQCKMCDIGVDE